MYLYPVIIVCVVLACSTVWKEYKSGRLRLGWRIVASLVAVAALVCIILPVSYPGEQTIAANEAVLITNGFSADSVNNRKGDSVLTFDPAVKKKYLHATLITPDQLKTFAPDISQLHVYGDGLNKAELDQLDCLPVVFHPSALSTGINFITWNDRLKQGQHLKIQGNYKNSSSKPVKLILKGLNTTADSLTIKPNTATIFELTDLPKVSGCSVYKLIAVADKDTLMNEDVPLVIEPVKPLKLLMLSAAPGFEDKFLKNWLSANGFSVAVRSVISKDKFNREFINMPQMPLNGLSANTLDKFDVVISDLSVLHALSGAESAALKQQVNDKGLGLIVKADTTFKTTNWIQSGFPINRMLNKEVKPLFFFINGKKTSATASGNDQNFIAYQNGTQTLVTDERNYIFAGINIAGNGKVVFTTLEDTYAWMLAGNKNDYTSFWSLLIGKATQVIPQSETWQTASAIATINEPVQLQVETGADPSHISIDNVLLSPVQNNLLGFQWQATWWPASTGWHSVKTGSGMPQWIYVNAKNSWASLKAAEKTIATKKYAENITLAAHVTKQIHPKSGIPVPKIYFYALLLLACTYLWIEGKLNHQAPLGS